jgi:hypothetical protein
VLEQLGSLFTVIFLVEAIIKIISDGLILGKTTYLRKATNVFDFAIVIGAVFELTNREKMQNNQ